MPGIRRVLLAAALAIATATPAAAQEGRAAELWRRIAEIDSAAAIRLIEDSHPGAAPELDDAKFQALLAGAKAHVTERLPKVNGPAAYSALMNGLATDFRDGHVWSRALFDRSSRTWAGVLISRRGGKWVVGAQDAAAGEPALHGAVLIGCDGVSADALARERLGRFAANPDVEAAMAKRASSLLIDDDNPYLTRPVMCDFADAHGTQRRLKLDWRPIAQARLSEIAAKAASPVTAGMGVSSFAGGQWIALETLGSRAPAVVAEVKARLAELHAAPMVVLDLRGNGGGDSSYGDEIAAMLVGRARYDAAGGARPDCSGQFWRATPRAIDAVRDIVARREKQDPRAATHWRGVLRDLEAAHAEGRRFSPALPACARGAAAVAPRPAGELPPATMRGRLVLVTDRSCFSSCLMTADLFRRLGALHVGEATDVSTRYMEVTEITLPSGLRTFSTLQKVSVGKGDFGPYVPERPYPGDLADAAALKAWVARLLG